MTNQLSIDFGSNPELAALFADSKVGDEVVVETRIIVTEKTGERLVGTIKEVVGEDSEKEPAEPTPNTPMMMEMGPVTGNRSDDDGDEA